MATTAKNSTTKTNTAPKSTATAPKSTTTKTNTAPKSTATAPKSTATAPKSTTTKTNTAPKSTATRSDTTQVKEGVTKATNGATAIVRQGAERALDVPVGAALAVRDRVEEVVEPWTSATAREKELRGLRTQVTRELNRFERRGGQARRKAVTRVEREVKARRREVEKQVKQNRTRVEKAVKQNRTKAEDQLKKATTAVQERVSSAS